MAKHRATAAGEHFARLLETNPEFRAGVEPSLAKLRAFAVCRRVDEPDAQTDADLQPLAPDIDRLRAAYGDMAKLQADWEAAFGAAYPKEIEDWYRWAARVGFSGERIAEGNWTLGDLFPIIDGYLQRL